MKALTLKAVQEEMKELLFFRPHEPASSRLWPTAFPDRLGVYRNNTQSNWTDTLDHDFPLTRKQFSDADWQALRARFFIKHPPAHWELNASMSPFVRWLKSDGGVRAHRGAPLHVQELADYEWNDLKVFVDRKTFEKGSGTTNPTTVVRAYQHQIFFWVEAGAPPAKPPTQKPEVLVFYRDSRNTCHIREADPLMILMLEHFRRRARLEDLEPVRRRLLPGNTVPLATVFDTLKKFELLL